MFKKIYVEITNDCNLTCSFCPRNNRKKEYITIPKFKKLLKKLKAYTNYLYFHIMGEPLLHKDINELIDIASKGFYINITTNGYLIKNIENNTNIRQINISLHSFNAKYGKNLDDYMSDIFKVCDKLALKGTYINYRLWTNFGDKEEVINRLEKKYGVSIKNEHTKLRQNTYLDFDETFTWPSISKENNEIGTCMGTRSHIGVLVDGTVVPCCLDNNGQINLGNIYKQELDDIINSDLFKTINEGFLKNKKVHELCKKCTFYRGER